MIDGDVLEKFEENEGKPEKLDRPEVLYLFKKILGRTNVQPLLKAAGRGYVCVDTKGGRFGAPYNRIRIELGETSLLFNRVKTSVVNFDIGFDQHIGSLPVKKQISLVKVFSSIKGLTLGEGLDEYFKKFMKGEMSEKELIAFIKIDSIGRAS